MARKIRLEYPGAVYHVMCRGDRREAIVRDDKDRWVFLDTLGESCERSGMRVHAYALLTNHYHLLLETPEGNLVKGMQWFQGTYTARFNARHHMSGHLFQGRYKAIPVDPEGQSYFRSVSDYIHLNPARAGLLNRERPRLGDYAWSSYRAFVGSKPLPPWLVRVNVFNACGLPDDDAPSRRRYAALMARRLREVLGEGESKAALESEWAGIRRGWALGDDLFKERLMTAVGKIMKGRRRSSYASDEPVRRHDEEEAARLLNRLEAAWAPDGWPSMRCSDTHKQVAAWVLRSRTTVSGAWIAERLRMGHVSNISRACRRLRLERGKGDLQKLQKEALHICKD